MPDRLAEATSREKDLHAKFSQRHDAMAEFRWRAGEWSAKASAEGQKKQTLENKQQAVYEMEYVVKVEAEPQNVGGGLIGLMDKNLDSVGKHIRVEGVRQQDEE